MVEFKVGDDDDGVGVFYAYHDPDDQNLVVTVKYMSHSSQLVVTDSDLGGNQGVRLASNAICGRAVDDLGWTKVYCIAMSRLYLVAFPLDTTSPDNLKNQLDGDNLFVESSALNDDNLVGLDAGGLFDANRRVGVTFQLADKHLSLLIPSGTKNSFVYNANDKTFSLYGQEADVEWGTNVMYATEAYKKDMVNLGCAGSSGGGGSGGSGGGGNDIEVCMAHVIKFAYLFSIHTTIYNSHDLSFLSSNS